ncbi:hypothetical protein [Ornithobacterium rhinotracheale]|uniref:hypothetical protein n=1 Tax=Ornithobacterium rhinotracheale TaxID=28251 RepID=UPI0040361426
MKRKILLLASLSLGAVTFAQQQAVGINTENPKVTLDVAGKPEDTSKMDGVRAPQITGDQLHAKTYTEDLKGAVVYVTKAAVSDNLEGQTINVKSEGYYYFNGEVWVAIVSKDGSPVDWHIWGNRGTDASKNFVGTLDETPLVFRVNNVPAGYISHFMGNTTTKGGGNVALGYEAMKAAKDINVAEGFNGFPFRQNIAIGQGSMKDVNPNSIMIQNVALGDRTLMKLQNGGTNIAIGDKAMAIATGANSSIAIGVNALYSLNTSEAWGNIALGYRVGEKMSSGKNNIFIKNYTGASGNALADPFKSGDSNIFIGQNSGQDLLTGNSNIAIGTSTKLIDGQSNQLNIANTIYGKINSKSPQIGIGTSVSEPATETFDVNGTMRVRNLPASGTAKAISTQANGNSSASKNQAFNATKMVVADDNGVLGTADLSGVVSSTSLYSKQINTDNAPVVVDLTNESATVFIIEDNSTNSANSTTIILPANRTTLNSTRIIRLMIIQNQGLQANNSGSLQIQPVGNRANWQLQAAQVNSGVVTIGNNTTARYSTIYTFTEFKGKWYMSVGEL